MTLARDPEKLREWQRRGRRIKRSPIKARSSSPQARKRRREQEGPQWRLCHETACAVCFLQHWRAERQGPVDWGQLPAREPSAARTEGHHETSRSLCGKDRDTIPLGCSRVEGGCGHHDEREHLGAAAFWDKHEMNPAHVLREMRRRVAEGWRP